ncbi:hypothetical protein Rhe02_84010 [Rhizocola hellebori]|uniref:Fibronectin type-III domain-containing protein n=1 Tax=Rhizocola hellebori TaxID=1392758 RepID=A0A8J3QG18_9ACTN|nr:fibronectin type III domain-containing protein [Rhizocola hellebori]GIH10334.1 hypothetical protein Rhe02_84010 [Rhizocola hellebori]
MSNPEGDGSLPAMHPGGAPRRPALKDVVIAVGILAAMAVFFVQESKLDIEPNIRNAVAFLGACIVAYQFAKNIHPTVTRILAGIAVIGVVSAYIFTPDPTPSAPKDLVAEPTHDQVKITWAVSSKELATREFAVYRINGSGSDDPVCPPRKTNTCVDDDVIAGSRYEYYAVAIDASGRMSAKALVTVAVPKRSTTLMPPRELMAAVLGPNSVRLSWIAGDGPAANFYTILRDGISVGNAEGTIFVDAATTPDSFYSYTVRANDASRSEQSGDSNPATVRMPSMISIPPPSGGGGNPGNGAGPQTPTGFTITTSTQTTITMSWMAAKAGGSPIARYNIYRNNQLHKTLTSDARSMQDTGLMPETTYRYAIAAVDSSGKESPLSAYRDGTTALSDIASQFTLDLRPGWGYDLDVLDPSKTGACAGGQNLNPECRDLYREVSNPRLSGVQKPSGSGNYNEMHYPIANADPKTCLSLTDLTKVGNVPISALSIGSRLCVRTHDSRWAMIEIVTTPPTSADVMRINVTLLR